MSDVGDNFTVVNLPDGATSESWSSKHENHTVLFHDLSEVYTTDSDLKCRYSFPKGGSPKAGDRIALYKVGWSSVTEYFTLIYTPSPENVSPTHHKVTFPVESLPKDEEMYQLCYITRTNELAGISIPFSFRKPHEDELVAIEDPCDPGLVVFRSRETQLQDQLSMAIEAKEMLETQVTNLSNELEKTKADLVSKSTDCIERQFRIDELEGQCQKLSTDKLSLEESLSNAKCIEKLIEQLNEKVKQLEDENTKHQVTISKYEADLKASEDTIAQLNENALSHENRLQEYKDLVNALKNESKTIEDKVFEANQKYSQLETSVCAKEEAYATEVKQLKNKLKKVNEKNEILSVDKVDQSERMAELVSTLGGVRNELDETVKSLEKSELEVAALSDDLVTVQERNTSLEDAKTVVEAKLASLEAAHSRCQERFEKSEGELTTSFMNTIKKLNLELKQTREELAKRKAGKGGCSTCGGEGSSSTRGGEGGLFRREINEVINMFVPKSNSSDAKKEEPAGTDPAEKVKQLITEKTELRLELVQSRHENKELKMVMKEANEEVAALKSRVAVLEVELRTAKSVGTGGDGVTGGGEEASEEFVDSITITQRCNQLEKDKKRMVEVLKAKEGQMAQVVKNCEGLMLKNAYFYQEIENLKWEKKSLREKLTNFESRFETVNEMQKALDDLEMSYKDLKGRLEEEAADKERLLTQLTNLRKESVGKVSLLSSREERETASTSQSQEAEDEEEVLLMSGLSRGERSSIICPFCRKGFAHSRLSEASKHIQDHVLRTTNSSQPSRPFM